MWISYGLLRSWKAGYWGLRDTLMYPQWMYYALLCYDIPARFAFIVALVLDPKKFPFVKDPLFYSTMLFAIELLRRFCWFLMRIESEQINNFEKFRQILEIPEVTEEVEDENIEQVKYS